MAAPAGGSWCLETHQSTRTLWGRRPVHTGRRADPPGCERRTAHRSAANGHLHCQGGPLWFSQKHSIGLAKPTLCCLFRSPQGTQVKGVSDSALDIRIAPRCLKASSLLRRVVSLCTSETKLEAQLRRLWKWSLVLIG